MEKDLQKRLFGVGIGLLGIFSYFFPLIPDGLKNIFAFAGVVLTIGYVLTPQLMVFPTALVQRVWCPPCKTIHNTEIQQLTEKHSTAIQQLTEKHSTEIQKISENNPDKNIRFKDYEKVVTIDKHGGGLINQSFELHNEGENYLQRFPIELATSASMVKTLKELERDNEFKIESKDGHDIRWETLIDNESTKKINIVFYQKIGPKETRKYTVRYNVEGLYFCKATSGKTYDYSSFKPIYLYEIIRIKVIFLPNYEYSNPRYCVYSPGGDLIDAKCRPLNQFDDTTGGTYVEVEEKHPWMHHTYQVEWDLPD